MGRVERRVRWAIDPPASGDLLLAGDHLARGASDAGQRASRKSRLGDPHVHHGPRYRASDLQQRQCEFVDGLDVSRSEHIELLVLEEPEGLLILVNA